MTIDAVIFDIGETLVDETRQWNAWAEAIGVPSFTFSAVLGSVIASGRPPADAFAYFGHPDFDIFTERQARMDLGAPDAFSPEDLYPDVRPTMDILKGMGYVLGVAANQPAHREALFRKFGLPLDLILISGALGLKKPSPEFFEELSRRLTLAPERIAYVGDRLDNDFLPATAAGMVAIFLRRGPWGHLQSEWPEASQVTLGIGSLTQLPDLLKELD